MEKVETKRAKPEKWENDLKKQAAELAEVTKKLASSRIVIERLEYEIQQERHTKKLQEDPIKRLQSERQSYSTRNSPTVTQPPTCVPPHAAFQHSTSHPQMSYANNTDILRLEMEVNVMKNHQQLMMNQMQSQLQAQQNQQFMFMMMNHQSHYSPRQ